MTTTSILNNELKVIISILQRQPKIEYDTFREYEISSEIEHDITDYYAAVFTIKVKTIPGIKPTRIIELFDVKLISDDYEYNLTKAQEAVLTRELESKILITG